MFSWYLNDLVLPLQLNTNTCTRQKGANEGVKKEEEMEGNEVATPLSDNFSRIFHVSEFGWKFYAIKIHSILLLDESDCALSMISLTMVDFDLYCFLCQINELQ